MALMAYLITYECSIRYYGLETIQIIQVLNNDIEDKACSYGNFKVQNI